MNHHLYWSAFMMVHKAVAVVVFFFGYRPTVFALNLRVSRQIGLTYSMFNMPVMSIAEHVWFHEKNRIKSKV